MATSVVPCCFGRAVGTGCTCVRVDRPKRRPVIKVGDRLYFATMGTVVALNPVRVEFDDVDGRVGESDILEVDREGRTIYSKARG